MPTITFLNDKQLAERLTVSRATIWRWVQELPGFPQPVKLAVGTTRWRLSDIEAWEATLIQEAR